MTSWKLQRAGVRRPSTANQPDHLSQLRLPAILHWDMVDFVVLKAYKRKGVVVARSGRWREWFPIAEVARHFTGVVLELSPTEEFCRTRTQRVRCPSTNSLAA